MDIKNASFFKNVKTGEKNKYVLKIGIFTSIYYFTQHDDYCSTGLQCDCM